MAEWQGSSAVLDGDIRYGWCWTKDVKYRDVECKLVLSVYDEDGVLPALLVYNPDGYESFACNLDDPSDVELREWAERRWEQFCREYDYIFDYTVLREDPASAI